MTDSPTALLLIAHGSRLRAANEDLEHLAAEIRGRSTYAVVQPSYLELSEPSIERGGEVCVEAGVERVILLPYFLSAGVHVRDDLTAARDALASRFPAVEFVLAEPLGRHPLLTEIVLDRAERVLRSAPEA
jgi:sirohydrochlorin ferrochelatase